MSLHRLQQSRATAALLAYDRPGLAKLALHWAKNCLNWMTALVPPHQLNYGES